mmetsp:Transcript_104546/g.305236  ORF Transcript_104546/g.305236 Transcript_104546/m.305236 type:complete len:112 (+) Transcript_104546:186-521(+)
MDMAMGLTHEPKSMLHEFTWLAAPLAIPADGDSVASDPYMDGIREATCSPAFTEKDLHGQFDIMAGAGRRSSARSGARDVAGRISRVAAASIGQQKGRSEASVWLQLQWED